MKYRSPRHWGVITVPVLLLVVQAVCQASGLSTGPAGRAALARTAPGGRPRLTPALARALSREVTDKVVIVFKNQLPGLADTPGKSARRTAAVRSWQRAVLAELAATHARGIKSISLVNAIAATVSAGEARRLAVNPAVAEVTPDQRIPYGSPAPALPGVNAARSRRPLPGACPVRKNAVQLDPEAVQAIHAATQSGRGASAQALGYTGAGVKVAFIADGADPNNPDFVRADGRHVFADNKDFSGTGTGAGTDGGEAFLDASSIAAQGRHVYNVAGYGEKLSVPCRIRVLGVAPGASLVDLNVIGSSSVVFSSVLLEAIDYAVTAEHVNVINESFGFNKYPDVDSVDLIELANDAAVKAGVTVTVASGDSGVTNTIASPASDPHIISAGATTTYRAYAQVGYGGITARGVRGWIDNNISGLSSGGFTQAGTTVDVVAPGDLNWALCSPEPGLFSACEDFNGQPSSVELNGGTSEAAPLTAGVAALVIQAYAQGHHGQRPAPAIVKEIIVSTAQDIRAPTEQQGAGMIDAYQAVLAARSYRGTTKAKAGHAVLDSSTQLSAVGAVSTPERFAETLTNDGKGPVTVHLHGRALSRYASVASRTLGLTAASSYTAAVKFRVRGGRARLSVSVGLTGFIMISLIAPDGDLAEYNLPQGPSNIGNAQVADPEKGTWTALISAQPLRGSPKILRASFSAQTASWRTFGRLSVRSMTLAQGASRRFSLTVSTPPGPGDLAGAIVLATTPGVPGVPGFTRQTTIPVTLRSLASSPARFSGTFTGGNGRGFNSGQAAYYEISVKPGTPALDVTISMRNHLTPLLAELVSPAGLVGSAATNTAFGATMSGTEVHVMRPAAGLWTLIADFFIPAAGSAGGARFTVVINSSGPGVRHTGLPTSTSTRLPAGSPVTAELTITSHSALPQMFFVDARLPGHVWLRLTPLTQPDLPLPDLATPVPTYLVPSLTSVLSAKVTAPVRNFFDLSWTLGDPDVLSSTGTTSTATLTAPELPNGVWVATPYRVGPDGINPVKPVKAHATMRALTAPIDTTISSPTGDLWLQSTKKNARLAPIEVKPGKTVAIPVRIDPKGTPGTVVTGTIYLSTVSFGSPGYNFVFGLADNRALSLTTATNVASFRYAYTIAAPPRRWSRCRGQNGHSGVLAVTPDQALMTELCR